ncbi:TonB-dependent siderophore receptor [Sphingomonas colocasiae]|uniref:TonB-dependent receptor n=1 Tax=Sphingomonas colocasiae TaxID=1848973 RepID=A0ABS7PXH5_9SPHN|nr:TonB-dependent receptor [Sphingomonas colocasiae]MBY8825047.1 TonB-dependent receptor [Sphingomonas colocasiae]
MIRKMIVGLSLSAATIASGALAMEPGEDGSGDDIIVTGRVAKLYRVEETASGKMPTEPLASSQAITVLTADLIADQGARDAQDLYRNISGVSFFSYAGVTARGFRQQENFYDGLRGDPYIGFAVPQLFNIERVEFLKGPAGMLYGQSAPGGLFNYVTKKPSQTFSASARMVAGTGDRYGAQAEVTGPVNDVVSLRGGAFFEDRDLPRTFAGNRSLLLDAGATFDLGIARLTTQAWRIEQDLAANRLRGIAVDADGHFLANRRWNHNEPSDFLDLRSTALQAKLEIEPTDNLKLDIAGRRIDASEKQKYHEPITLLDKNGDGRFDAVARQYRDQYRGTKSWSFGGNAVWSAAISDGVSNRVLAGFDYSTEDATSTASQLTGRATAAMGLPCPLDFANPVYRACDPARYAMPAATTTLSETRRNGFYLLNELTLGRLVAVAGIRTDSFEDVAIAANGTRTGFKGRDETYRLGLVWRVRDDVSLFGQYATSFEPQSAAAQDPRAGGPFAPTTGDMMEGGVKTALLGGRLQSSLSVYRIKRQNLLQADPRGDPEGDGINNSVAFGEVTSKGVDVDIAADLTDNWVLTLTYAYNDTRVTKSTTPANGNITNVVAGGRFANAPRNKLGFWTRYQIPAAGLAFALGGDYVSKRISLSNQPVNPYFIFDGSITWARGPWDVRLRVDNILDKTYAASGFNDRGGHFPGEPRSAFVEVGYRF